MNTLLTLAMLVPNIIFTKLQYMRPDYFSCLSSKLKFIPAAKNKFIGRPCFFSIRSPDPPPPLEERASHGLGLFLYAQRLEIILNVVHVILG